MSFRVLDRIDSPRIDRFSATAAPDHRPLYLEYEGPVAGDRGTVARVATGWARIVRGDADHLDLVAAFPGRRARFLGERAQGGSWTFVVSEVTGQL